jgi:hypothetical protein
MHDKIDKAIEKLHMRVILHGDEEMLNELFMLVHLISEERREKITDTTDSAD